MHSAPASRFFNHIPHRRTVIVSFRDQIWIALCFALIWAFFAIPILRSPLGSYPVVDAAWHSAWATEIAGGNLSIYAPYFRAPLYPAVLGLVYLLSGCSEISGILLSFALCTAALLVVYRIVFHIHRSRRKALAAAAITGINGVFLFYSTTLLIAPLYILLLLCSFYLFQKDSKSKYGWFFLGLAAVARPAAVLLFPLAIVLYRRSWKYCWQLLLPLSGVWLVNATTGDPWTVISSQGGINFYIGSGPEADGYTSFAPETGGLTQLPDSLPYRDNVWAASIRPFPRAMEPSRVSSEWIGRTLDYIKENPGSFAFLMAKKLLYAASPVAIPSNYDVYYYTRYSPLAGLVEGTPGFPVAGLLIWLLVPGALAAGPLKSGERNALLWASVLCLGVLPFFITARFLLPVLPFVVILLGPRFLSRPIRSLALAPLGLALGLGIARLTEHTVESGGVNMAFHDGLAHYRLGLVEESEMLLLQSLDVAFERNDGIDLNGTDALFNLGIIALRRGDPDEAETYWRMALERNPDFVPAIQALQGLTHWNE